MSLLNYKLLFHPYTGDGHKWERTLAFWEGEAKKRNIPHEVLELALNEVFTRISNGYNYPMDKCPCGCGIDKKATALIHDVVLRMVAIEADRVEAATQVMQIRYDLLIQEQLKKISKTNKEYIRMNRPPLSQRSPVLRFFKRLFTRKPKEVEIDGDRLFRNGVPGRI